MNQEEKTILLIEFWEEKTEMYMNTGDTKSAARCDRHVKEFRNDFV